MDFPADTALDGPEPDVTGLVDQVADTARIDRYHGDELSLEVSRGALVGWPVMVYQRRYERFDTRRLGAAQGVKLGELYDPFALHLHQRVLPRKVGDMIQEPCWVVRELTEQL